MGGINRFYPSQLTISFGVLRVITQCACFANYDELEKKAKDKNEAKRDWIKMTKDKEVGK